MIIHKIQQIIKEQGYNSHVQIKRKADNREKWRKAQTNLQIDNYRDIKHIINSGIFLLNYCTEDKTEFGLFLCVVAIIVWSLSTFCCMI